MKLHPHFRDVKWHKINQEITHLKQHLANEPEVNSVSIEAAITWSMLAKKEKEKLKKLEAQLKEHEHWLQWG